MYSAASALVGKDLRMRLPSVLIASACHSLLRRLIGIDDTHLSLDRFTLMITALSPRSAKGNQVLRQDISYLCDDKTFAAILSSTMHMAWVRVVSGRLKSDYSYSPAVYNNYPWPESPTDAQKQAVEREAQAVLDARALYRDSTLAALYDPVLMPPELVKAHQRSTAPSSAATGPNPSPPTANASSSSSPSTKS